MRTFPSLIICVTVLFETACGSTEEQINRSAAAAQSASATTTPDGAAIFRQYCVTCHGADGKLGLNGAKDLSASILTPEERINIITYGKKIMTPFNEVLTPEEIKAVAEYTQKLATPTKER
jgi:mono/diheme cytochrome c family protein